MERNRLSGVCNKKRTWFSYPILAYILLFSVSCGSKNSFGFDENALSALPHFEYLGYIYYIHPHLAVHSIDLSTGGYGYAEKDWESSVASLDSYGYDSWFLPTVSELLEAARLGLLQKEFAYYPSDGHFLYYDSFTGSNSWVSTYVIEGHTRFDFTVVPMIKLRMR